MYVRTHIYIFATYVLFDDVIMSPTHLNNYPGVMINRANFDFGRPSIF